LGGRQCWLTADDHATTKDALLLLLPAHSWHTQNGCCCRTHHHCCCCAQTHFRLLYCCCSSAHRPTPPSPHLGAGSPDHHRQRRRRWGGAVQVGVPLPQPWPLPPRARALTSCRGAPLRPGKRGGTANRACLCPAALRGWTKTRPRSSAAAGGCCCYLCPRWTPGGQVPPAVVIQGEAEAHARIHKRAKSENYSRRYKIKIGGEALQQKKA